jgi:hypothetical protein
MRTKIGLAAGAMLVPAALIGVYASPAVSGDAATASSVAAAVRSTADDRTERLRLVARSVKEVELDLGAKGFSVGDRVAFSDNLFREGKRVGTDGGDCAVVRLAGNAATFHCVITLELPKGQITSQGLFTFREPPTGQSFPFAITGGTGSYRTAQGEIVVSDLEDTDNEARLDLRIILDD